MAGRCGTGLRLRCTGIIVSELLQSSWRQCYVVNCRNITEYGSDLLRVWMNLTRQYQTFEISPGHFSCVEIGPFINSLLFVHLYLL